MMRIKLRDGHWTQIGVPAAVDLILERARYVRQYDALPQGDPDKLELIDLAFPAYLGAVPDFRAVLNPHEWAQLDASLKAASDVLGRVPAHVSLTEWSDTEAHQALLVELFRATTGSRNHALPGFGPARCTKMLHKKRPALIPILDRWQLHAWEKPVEAWRTADMASVVFAIRDVLIPQVEEFHELSWRLKLQDSSLPHLSAVRLYDILFWELSRDGHGAV
jgi:hypothetical protein